jgi:hypothetical protein
VGETYGAAGGIPLTVWKLGLAIVAISVAYGAMRRILMGGDEGRWLFTGLVVLLASAWLIAVAVRTLTSFYLVYFVFPLSAIVMGAALDGALASARAWIRAIAGTAVVFLVLSLGATAAGVRVVGEAAFIDSRILALGDLMHPGTASARGSFATAAARDSLAHMACAQAEPVFTVHGEFAYTLAASTGLDLRIHCPASKTKFVLMGKQPGPHVTALPAAAIEALGIRGARPHRGLYSLPVAATIHPDEGRAIEADWYYFERLRDPKALAKVSLAFPASPGGLMMIYRLKPFTSQWRLLRVEFGGLPVEPAFTTYDSALYRARSGAAPGAAWTVEFETDAPQWVDVHTF